MSSIQPGQLIRNRRRELNLSMRELAHRIEADYTYISKIECGKCHPPSKKLLRHMATALDVDADELVNAFQVPSMRKAMETARWYIAECCQPRNGDDRSAWVNVLETIDAALEAKP